MKKIEHGSLTTSSLLSWAHFHCKISVMRGIVLATMSPQLKKTSALPSHCLESQERRHRHNVLKHWEGSVIISSPNSPLSILS